MSFDASDSTAVLIELELKQRLLLVNNHYDIGQPKALPCYEA